MDGWKKIRLGDILEEYCERNNKKEYKPVAVGKYGIRRREEIYSKKLSKDISKNKIIRKNTLIIGMGSNQIDIGVLVDDKIYSVSPAYTTYKIKNCNSKYVEYLFEILNRQISDMFMIIGARQGKSVDKEGLLNYIIKLPPLEEQRKIVNKINLINDIINRLNTKKEEYRKLYKKILEKIFENVENKKKVRLETIIKEMADIGSNGSNESVSKHLNMKDEEDYAIMVRTSNLSNNDFRRNIKFISKDSYNYFEKSKLYGNEIIMNKIGSPGKFWMMPDLGRPMSLGLNQILIRTNENVKIKYLYYFLKSRYAQKQIRKSISGGVTKSITKGAIKKFLVWIPNENEQKNIIFQMELFERINLLIEDNIKFMEKLKKGIMQKLLTGKVRVKK